MFLVGANVQVAAADDFFAFCDGWRGVVHGVNNGLVEVRCTRQDGVKTLFVPPEQLVRVTERRKPAIAR